MTTKALTAISWTARILAVFGLLLPFVFSIYFDSNPPQFREFKYLLVLLGIAITPSRVLSGHRVLSGIALCFSLIPLLLLFAGMVIVLLSYVQVVSTDCWSDPCISILFCILAVGICSLPIALGTADALARRGDPVRALGKWARLVLLAVGGMVLILSKWFMT
jgi:hypothetical protein